MITVKDVNNILVVYKSFLTRSHYYDKIDGQFKDTWKFDYSTYLAEHPIYYDKQLVDYSEILNFEYKKFLFLDIEEFLNNIDITFHNINDLTVTKTKEIVSKSIEAALYMEKIFEYYQRKSVIEDL